MRGIAIKMVTRGILYFFNLSKTNVLFKSVSNINVKIIFFQKKMAKLSLRSKDQTINFKILYSF